MYNDSKNSLKTYISDREYQIFEMVNFFIITSAIGAFGIETNVMNIVVFIKQGFSNTMNISFLGLAISDLCSIITILLFNVLMSPTFANAGIAFKDIQHLTAGLPHICFSRITCWITVFITAERCLCITLPLQIKQLITPRRTTIIICAIYILIILSFEPEYETAYYGWKFDVKTNRSLIGLLFTSRRKDLQGLTFILFSVLGFVSFISVIMFTLILVLQLNKKSKWRKSANLEASRSETISNRDRKTVTMVVMIATVLIVCYTPGVAVSLATFFESEFSVIGRYMNLYFTSWSFVVILQVLNSSINIVVYYYMSSKYRETFLQVFDCFQSHLATI